MQEPVPLKPAATRFPPWKPLLTQQVCSTEVGIGSARPIMLYLADHNPHLVAPAPTAPIARPHYFNGVSLHEGQAEEGEFELQDVELKEPQARPESLGSYGGYLAQGPHVCNPMNEGGPSEGQGKVSFKVRNRNFLIVGVLILALVVAIVVFAVLVSLADR